MRLLVFAIFAIFACITVGWAGPAWPMEALPHQMTYHFTFGNLRFGALTLNGNETGNSYTLASTAKTSGVVRVFSKHESNSKAEGTLDAAAVHPKRYETEYTSKRKLKHIVLDYDASGNITDTYLHEDTRKPEEKVPASLKQGAYDPISALMLVRQKLEQAKTSGAKSFTFLLYDGTRLSKITVDILADTAPINNTSALHTTFKRTPVAGWKEKDLQKYNAAPEPLLHAWFSDDAQLLPLSLALDLNVGTIKGFLVQKQ